MALGREDYNGQKYEAAAAAFAKVGSNDPDALEAGFYRGLSLLFSGDYPGAEQAFGGVARVLPLAEVVNNQGVAVSRQGHNAIALFRQTVAADPNAADYHFNLAVSLKRHGDGAAAASELTECLRLRPNDSEAEALLAAWTAPESKSAPAAGAEPRTDPLERIARSFDEVAFRQAAQMMDQMGAAHLATLTPRERALALAGQARDYLDRGLLLEAERLYLSAVASDPKAAEAHAGLAEVRERTGDLAAARSEAETSLRLLPSVNAYLVMGRLNLGSGHPDWALQNVNAALQIDAGSGPAQALRREIQAKQAQGR
jgi:tetratricopeptide (TPR) repeat protein